MGGIEDLAVNDLFSLVEEEARTNMKVRRDKGPASYLRTVRVHYVELAGKEIRDLISNEQPNTPTGNSEVKIIEKDGQVQLLNSTAQVVKCPKDLSKAIALGKSRRATASTDANSVSSRSHAVCQIELIPPSNDKVSCSSIFTNLLQ